jgi:archaellum biogenesis ATPase FlaH
LTKADLEELERESWIDPDTAKDFGLYRVSSAEGAGLVGRTDHEDHAGIVFPVYATGRPGPREYYLRRDHPPIEGGKPKGKYLAPPDRPNILMVGPGESVEALADTSQPIIIVEGLKKLLAAYRLARHNSEHPRFLVCAVNGVYGYRGTVGKTTDPKGARIDEKGVIPDFARFTWTGRDVVVIFDSDCTTNPKVATARRGLIGELKKRGARAVALDLPTLDGLNKTGFDDFLAQRGPEEAIALIQTARITPTSGPTTQGGFAPISAATLLDEPEGEHRAYVLEDYLYEGSLGLLAAKPKIGKSTLLYELAVKVALGRSFLGRATQGGGVLILAVEEHRRDVRQRFQSLSAEKLENIHVHVGPLPDNKNTYQALLTFIRNNGIKLVIVDTLNTFWSVEDENSATQVTAAVKPLLSLARESGAAVLLIHHSRKGDGDHGDEIRGSGALFSLLDVALILKRHEVENQRRLTAVSRYSETPAELIIELRDHGYEALGDPAAVGKRSKLSQLESVLTTLPTEVKALACKAGVSPRGAYELLKQLAADGRAIQSGTGRRSDPRLYSCNRVAPSNGTLHAANPLPPDQEKARHFVACSPPLIGSYMKHESFSPDSTRPDSLHVGLIEQAPPTRNETEFEEIIDL